MIDSLEKMLECCGCTEAEIWAEKIWGIMTQEVRHSAVLIRKHSETVLIKSGEKPEAVFFMLDGSAKIYKELSNGILYEIASVKSPYLFGETEVITGCEFSRGTVCVDKDNSAFIYMSSDIFLHWLKTSNEALFEFTKFIIGKNFSQQAKDRAMLFTHGYERLAYRLVSYYDEEFSGGEVSLKISRERLSEDTGLNIRSISRAINKLEEMMYISRRGRSIVITPMQAEKMKMIVYN